MGCGTPETNAEAYRKHLAGKEIDRYPRKTCSSMPVNFQWRADRCCPEELRKLRSILPLLECGGVSYPGLPVNGGCRLRRMSAGELE